jgi:hypothetical protein
MGSWGGMKLNEGQLGTHGQRAQAAQEAPDSQQQNGGASSEGPVAGEVLPNDEAQAQALLQGLLEAQAAQQPPPVVQETPVAPQDNGATQSNQATPSNQGAQAQQQPPPQAQKSLGLRPQTQAARQIQLQMEKEAMGEVAPAPLMQ